MTSPSREETIVVAARPMECTLLWREPSVFSSAIRLLTGMTTLGNTVDYGIHSRITKLDYSYVPCYDRFESMKRCFYDEIKETAEKQFGKPEF